MTRRETRLFSLMFALLALLLCARAHAQTLPNSKLTPGATSTLTVGDLCDPAFHTGTVRAVSLKEKREVCDTYEAANCPGQAWELDHLISLEIGGANVPANLWPQPIAEARKKDVIENALHKWVCGAPPSLRASRLLQAQSCIRTNWTSCAKVMGVK